MKLLLFAAAFFAISANAGVIEIESSKYDFSRPGILVDVRTPAEWASGTIAGAKKISITDASGNVNEHFSEQIGELASGKEPLVLICRSGSRSLFAAHQLIKSGYKGKIISLKGGMLDVDATSVQIEK